MYLSILRYSTVLQYRYFFNTGIETRGNTIPTSTPYSSTYTCTYSIWPYTVYTCTGTYSCTIPVWPYMYSICKIIVKFQNSKIPKFQNSP